MQIKFSENTSIEDINNFNPDGIFLSNGPGDPSATEIKCRKLLSALFQLKIPVFGICIGHQLIGLSFGAKTNKMLKVIEELIILSKIYLIIK